jgi:hypothetical protein
VRIFFAGTLAWVGLWMAGVEILHPCAKPAGFRMTGKEGAKPAGFRMTGKKAQTSEGFKMIDSYIPIVHRFPAVVSSKYGRPK